jgi:DNA-binding response OmpR family regulator
MPLRGSASSGGQTTMATAARQLVLVVEDHVITRDLVERVLRLKGFDTCSADSAAGALEIFHNRHPAAAVVDLRLREGSGSEVIASIPSGVPVIICSGAPSESRGLELFRPNTCLVTKPFSVVLLVEVLQGMMRARGGGLEASE